MAQHVATRFLLCVNIVNSDDKPTGHELNQPRAYDDDDKSTAPGVQGCKIDGYECMRVQRSPYLRERDGVIGLQFTPVMCKSVQELKLVLACMTEVELAQQEHGVINCICCNAPADSSLDIGPPSPYGRHSCSPLSSPAVPSGSMACTTHMS